MKKPDISIGSSVVFSSIEICATSVWCMMCKAHQSTMNWNRVHSTTFDWLGFSLCLALLSTSCVQPYSVLCYAVCFVAFFAWICRNVYFKHGWLCYSRFVFNARSVCTVYTQQHCVRRLFSSFVRSISLYFSLLFPNRFRCCPFKCHLLFLSIFMNGFCFRRAAIVVFQRLCSFERNPFISFFLTFCHIIFAATKNGLHSEMCTQFSQK